MSLYNLFRNRADPSIPSGHTEMPTLTLTNPDEWRMAGLLDGTSTSSAMKIGAVSACIDIRSDSIGKMPFYVMNRRTRTVDSDHAMSRLLRVRPNEIMTPFVFKKLLETWRLTQGNAYVYLSRSTRDGQVTDMLPLNPTCVHPIFDEDGRLWYRYENGTTRAMIESDSVIHLKGFSDDGLMGTSVLSRASETISAMREQQQYEGKFYSQNARPSGILTVEGDLQKEAKTAIRQEWQKIYGGADNAFKVAILDHGLDYKPIAMSQRDAQFVESKEISVADIARFFLVPLYKLQSGKQTYQSNEQNSIEYVVTALAPTVKQYEEELTYKSLFAREVQQGQEVVINLNAELRGDTSSRGEWYKRMRDMGAYSTNDIRELEDLPDVDGGDIRIAPLNNIPLSRMEEYFDYLMSRGKVANQGGDPTGDDGGIT